MTDDYVHALDSGPDQAALLAAMRLATRAPSVHNTQPWRWEYCDRQLRLYRDDDRSLPSADPTGRQLIISCGAMLDHVRTAFAAEGWRTDTVRQPTPYRPDHLATLVFRPWPDPPSDLRTRAGMIGRRRTDRLPMSDPGDLSDLVRTARSLTEPYDVIVGVLGTNALARLEAASEQSTALRRYDMTYQTELRWWSGHKRSTEGVPVDALISESEAVRVPVGRKFPAHAHSARRGELEDQARLWVLSTPDDSVLHWLRTGEALSTVLLECTAAGLATCPMTHITELPTTRRAVMNLAGSQDLAQVVVRVGLAPDHEEHPVTPRRPPSDFLTIHPDISTANDKGL
ncbi:Acg family FMN-binding oxidoreductase [Nocardia brevicatena]|uniref:Acg family FMN-binding oxidoreductase n=1 Tax=Nocardia brevicatena TaxID=37327 RepID=UPI0002D43F99|nr:nitroreductase family protein [Nocardia brevicatena]